MRKYLLPQGGNFYKANLHSHSIVSDGRLSPERMKEEYVKRGYSIIAYTDHNVMVDHSYLADENFLPLIGWEWDATECKMWADGPKTCHVCFIALEKENAKQHVVTRSSVPKGAAAYAEHVRYDENTPEIKKEYSASAISAVMQSGREQGFFVTYNHPAWSLETANEYLNYHGMHAMEICNYGCFAVGFEDYNAYIYDDILRSGNRIYCTATDDNHNARQDDLFNDSFGGFTMIAAEKLEYRTITRALENGDFYASMGPEIYELYYEDGTVYIKCSPSARIALHCGKRYGQTVWAKDGNLLTQAAFQLPERELGYFRLSVMGADGKMANTNAFFTDTLKEE